MKKLALLAGLFSLSLFAAEFWQSKPFTSWSDKDVQRLMTSSPWAKTVSIAPDSVGSGGGGGKRGKGGGGGMGDTGVDSGANSGPASGMGGAGGGRGGPQEVNGGGPAGGAPSIEFFVRWQSSLPVKEAMMRAKYGSEAATSPESKKFLETEEKYYILAIEGVPAGRRGQADPEGLKTTLKKDASLVVKGKDPILPVDVEVKTQGRQMNAFFFFPKTDPLTLDDKEVEFESKVGDISVKSKFRLKDMTVDGKLVL